MKIDNAKLQALAKAAKSGGAEWSDLHVDTEHMYTAEGALVNLYEFATPDVLLELCNDNEALRGLYQMHKQTETREMRDLKAEVAGLKTGYEAYERVNAELRAECEALRNNQSFSDAFYEVSNLLGVTGARPEAPLVVFRQEVVPALQAVISNSRRYEWHKIRGNWVGCDAGKWRAYKDEKAITEFEDSQDAAIDAAMDSEASQ